jgi:predicted nucleic acid-binding protein
MQLICSDTNVWIDFAAIDKTELPFRLPYTYLMNIDAVNDEFLSPPGLGEKLVSFGLVPVEMTAEEFDCAEEYGWKYPRLLVYDRVALAMAKCRGIPLLTGDKALRRAAVQETVEVMGTLYIFDRLSELGLLSDAELEECLRAILAINGGTVRLPEAEIMSRIDRLAGRKMKGK